MLYPPDITLEDLREIAQDILDLIPIEGVVVTSVDILPTDYQECRVNYTYSGGEDSWVLSISVVEAHWRQKMTRLLRPHFHNEVNIDDWSYNSTQQDFTVHFTYREEQFTTTIERQYLNSPPLPDMRLPRVMERRELGDQTNLSVPQVDPQPREEELTRLFQSLRASIEDEYLGYRYDITTCEYLVSYRRGRHDRLGGEYNTCYSEQFVRTQLDHISTERREREYSRQEVEERVALILSLANDNDPGELPDRTLTESEARTLYRLTLPHWRGREDQLIDISLLDTEDGYVWKLSLLHHPEEGGANYYYNIETRDEYIALSQRESNAQNINRVEPTALDDFTREYQRSRTGTTYWEPGPTNSWGISPRNLSLNIAEAQRAIRSYSNFYSSYTAVFDGQYPRWIRTVDLGSNYRVVGPDKPKDLTESEEEKFADRAELLAWHNRINPAYTREEDVLHIPEEESKETREEAEQGNNTSAISSRGQMQPLAAPA